MTNVAVVLFVLLSALPAFAQVDCNEGMQPLDNNAPSPMSALQFTRTVSVRESALVKAVASFGYKVKVHISTRQGDFRQAFDVGFDAAGARTTASTGPTVNTLTRLELSPKDVNAFVTEPLFALTPDTLGGDKDAVYSGRQRLGDHDASVFDLLPRNDQAPLRGFIGRVWVWAGKSAVLKSCGRAANYPIGPLRYEIRRQQVGEDNWFPVSMRADEDLRTESKPVHVSVEVKYYDYKAR